MRHAAHAAHRLLIALFAAGVVVEFFLAGLGVFRMQHVATAAGSVLTTVGFAHDFGAHLAWGDVLFVVMLVGVALALAARLGRRRVLVTVGLFALLCVQATLAFVGPPAVRALHPVLGVILLGAALYVLLWEPAARSQ